MHCDYLFVGGGLSSALCVLALLHRAPWQRIAIVEQGPTLGGNHTWCFHAADVSAEECAWVSPLIVERWAGYHVRFPRRIRRLSSAYACVTSERLHQVVAARLEASGGKLLLSRRVTRIERGRVQLEDGSALTARVVVDARGPDVNAFAGTTGFQKFFGLELRAKASPGFAHEPLLMDACLPQHDGFRFMYVLPLSDDRWLFEETFFSDNPELDEKGCAERVLRYARAQGFDVQSVTREERGVLPMPWQFDPPSVPEGTLLAGYRGGFFHPVTGYSFPVAVRYASALAVSPQVDAAHSELARFTARNHEQQRFLFLLTRMMFGLFEPENRFEILEHFYRLPEPVIERFYAATLRPADRARLFLGPPPRGLSLKRALGLGTFKVAERRP